MLLSILKLRIHKLSLDYHKHVLIIHFIQSHPRNAVFGKGLVRRLRNDVLGEACCGSFGQAYGSPPLFLVVLGASWA